MARLSESGNAINEVIEPILPGEIDINLIYRRGALRRLVEVHQETDTTTHKDAEQRLRLAEEVQRDLEKRINLHGGYR